ncbi:hypothetical protein D4R89_10625 [bacterium]|jgi:hypothetical protein|nr:MAG: hypothetical protein D4R89_10625 [bacterium]
MGEKHLKANLEFVQKNKDQLLKEYKNKYLLVVGEKIVGSFDTYENAAAEGVRSFGIDGEFLVYHLTESEPLNFIMEAIL